MCISLYYFLNIPRCVQFIISFTLFLHNPYADLFVNLTYLIFSLFCAVCACTQIMANSVLLAWQYFQTAFIVFDLILVCFNEFKNYLTLFDLPVFCRIAMAIHWQCEYKKNTSNVKMYWNWEREGERKRERDAQRKQDY